MEVNVILNAKMAKINLPLPQLFSFPIPFVWHVLLRFLPRWLQVTRV